MRPKSCIVCGARTNGDARCEVHKTQLGTRSRSCIVCGARTMGNYCPAHDPETNEQIRNERNPYRKSYQSPIYKVNRRRRYEMAKGRCEDCGTPVVAGEWECDHLIALRDGGTDSVNNLRIRCIIQRPGASRGCHGIKTRADRRNR